MLKVDVDSSVIQEKVVRTVIYTGSLRIKLPTAPPLPIIQGDSRKRLIWQPTIVGEV